MATHRLTALSLATLAVVTPMVGSISVAPRAFAATPTIGTVEPSPSAMTIEDTQAVMDAYLAALVAREDIAPYFSDDVVLELVDVGQRIEGRDEVVDAIVELHEQTFDARPELTNLVIGEGTAAAELVFVGTHTGDFAGIPATGMQVAVPYAAFYDLADAKITALRIHGFATGLVAALTAEATPASTTPAP
jgi:predicted ester cyclase